MASKLVHAHPTGHPVHVAPSVRRDPPARPPGHPEGRALPAGCTALTLFLALAFSAAPAAGQLVRGEVVEEGTEAPVEGAMVVLLDMEEHTVHRVLTDGSGSFILDADHPGPHRIRVDRIGYESVVTPPFDVPVDGTFRQVAVPIRPVELAGLDVEGERRCEVRGDQGASTARAWEEARKALQAAAWTLESGVYRYTLLNFTRRLDRDGRTVLNEDRRFARSSGQAPYVSAPPQKLVDEGFITEGADGALTYFAPDAAAFLSDPFLDTHCMRLDRVKDGQVGLVFEPVKGRDVPEIRGTLWLDAATAQLNRLDFQYVNRRPGRDMGNAGGEVVFGHLPNGTWVVREWNIRMPLLATTVRRDRLILNGYEVQGGVVWRVSDPDGTTVVEASTASLAGSVTDSLGTSPLGGATVRTLDGSAEAVTESAGTFLLPGLAGGLQTVQVTHPSLDTLHLGPLSFQAETALGEVSSARFRLPGVHEVLSETCAGSPEPESEATMVLGRVHQGDLPAAGVPVRIRWLGSGRRGFEVSAWAAPREPSGDPPRWAPDPEEPRWVVTTLDHRGIFLVCGVPTPSQLRVEVGEDGAREVRTVTLPGGAPVVVIPITLPEPPPHRP